MNENEINQNQYGVDQIEALDSRSAVRKRPGMYLGSTAVSGINQCCFEIIDNSIDEFIMGYGNEININILKDATIVVADRGRGIPVGPHKKWKNTNGTPMDTLTGTLITLHAGGKFSDDGYFGISSGLHGVGSTCVNFLSDFFEVIVKREGKIYCQQFKTGIPITQNPEVIGKCNKNDTGTTITYHPDKEIFKITLEPNCKDLQKRLNELTSLNMGLKINYKNEISDINREIHYPDGISGYVKRLIENENLLYDEPIYIKGNHILPNGKIIIVEIAFIHVDNEQPSEIIKTFANNINTYEGGYHLQGFRNSYKKQLNKYGIDNKLTEESIELKYLLDGICAVISIKIPDPEFEGQTKTKLGSSEAEIAVSNVMDIAFEKMFKNKENKNIFETLVTRALKVKEAEEAARKARALTRKAGKANRMALPGKLADCANKNGYSELMIVEGDSAGGCLARKTKVKLVDGRNIAIEDLVEEFNNGIKNYVYSSTPSGMITIQPILDAFKTKTAYKLVKIILDNREEFKCTPEHPIMLRDGTFKEVQLLTKDDSLMPLYCIYSNVHMRIWNEKLLNEENGKYEFIKLNVNNEWAATHIVSATQYYGYRPKGYHTHHKNGNSLNNNPENIEYKEAFKHLSDHQKEYYSDENNKKITSDGVKKYYKEHPEAIQTLSERATEQMLNGKGWLSAHREHMQNDPEYREMNRKKFHSPEKSEKRKKSLRIYFSDDKNREKLSIIAIEQWDNEELRQWRSEETKKQMSNPEMVERIKESKKINLINKGLSIINEMIANKIEINKSQYENLRKNKLKIRSFPKWETLNNNFNNLEELIEQAKTYNHKIISIELIDEIADVYDLTIPPYNNFALSSGIFVHNSAKNGRFREFQAILPLFGKLLNTEKSTEDKMIDSEKIKILIAALQAGVGDTFDINKVRYDKIIIMSDSDVDGFHISALLLTFFYNYMRPLIEEGRVYLACPPLYRITKGKNSFYVKDDQELREYKKKNGSNFDLIRFKGLGEMSHLQLKETVMNPETRTLKKITIEDAEAAVQIFNIWMGNQPQLRRDYIEANANQIILD